MISLNSSYVKNQSLGPSREGGGEGEWYHDRFGPSFPFFHIFFSRFLFFSCFLFFLFSFFFISSFFDFLMFFHFPCSFFSEEKSFFFSFFLYFFQICFIAGVSIRV